MESILPSVRNDTPSPAGLESHLGYWLRRVSNEVSLGFSRKLQALGVSVAEWVAMRLLYDQPSYSPSRLAKDMGITPGAVTKITAKLSAKGWLHSRTHVADHRGQTLELSPVGREILPQLAQLADANDAYFFGVLSRQEQATLRKLMQRLSDVHGWKNKPIG